MTHVFLWGGVTPRELDCLSCANNVVSLLLSHAHTSFIACYGVVRLPVCKLLVCDRPTPILVVCDVLWLVCLTYVDLTLVILVHCSGVSQVCMLMVCGVNHAHAGDMWC